MKFLDDALEVIDKPNKENVSLRTNTCWPVLLCRPLCIVLCLYESLQCHIPSIDVPNTEFWIPLGTVRVNLSTLVSVQDIEPFLLVLILSSAPTGGIFKLFEFASFFFCCFRF